MRLSSRSSPDGVVLSVIRFLIIWLNACSNENRINLFYLEQYLRLQFLLMFHFIVGQQQMQIARERETLWLLGGFAFYWQALRVMWSERKHIYCSLAVSITRVASSSICSECHAMHCFVPFEKHKCMFVWISLCVTTLLKGQCSTRVLEGNENKINT